MTSGDFTSLVGGEVIHITQPCNAEGIASTGLMSAADLARRAGLASGDIALRRDRQVLSGPGWNAQLNHQNPLRMGMSADFLDGHTLHSWAAQLDERVFFWPARKGAAFARSLGAEACVFRLEATGFFDMFADALFLCPINSGNATRRPARRGDWIYVPATAGVSAFRENRRKRGLVQGPDSVVELSLICPLPADALRRLML
jgi:hypothetical protein